MASLKRWIDRRKNPWKGVFFDALARFRKEGGAEQLYSYGSLPAGATVLDIGGFKGEWTDRILQAQPDCTVHIFEPHPGFAAVLREKFNADGRVHVHECALGAQNGRLELSDAGDASSSVANHSRSYTAEVVSVAEFFTGLPSNIALAKLNIEGGEYSLLPALFDAGLLPRIDRLQVQFHLFEEPLLQARDEVIDQISQSHSPTWSYPFVWEEWKRTTKK